MNAAVNKDITRRHLALKGGMLHAVLIERMTRVLGREPAVATARDVYDALSIAIREELTLRWLATQKRVAAARAKRLCYLSVEYLPGNCLLNALYSLGDDMVQEACETLEQMGFDLEQIAAQEVDPGLGNGGLGRLAACFLDSLATQQYAAVGYGIRYDYGIFTQLIDERGAQRETASSWLKLRNPWESPRSELRYTVRLGGRSIPIDAGTAQLPHRWLDAHEIHAIAFDQLVPGNCGATVNHLRLWSGRALTPFRIDAFNEGDYAAAVQDQIEAKNLSRVLYPDDSTPQGRELRFKQQYFFVSASLQDMLATHLAEQRSLDSLPDALAIQLNDTHPTLAIPELMRLLIDEYLVPWEEAWRITCKVFSYTNHTLLPEALECWPVAMFERWLPRHLEIIYLINRDFLALLAEAYPGDADRQRDLSIISVGENRYVRMAHLAVIGSHRVNGVARLHSELMRKRVFSGFAHLYPERFVNVTNGIAVRRWLKQSNPGLSRLLTERVGSGWENDLAVIGSLRGAAEEPHFRQRFRDIKLANKRQLAELLRTRHGMEVDPSSLFDVQVKRIHEYKRQTLNILQVVARYEWIKRHPRSPIVPRTVIFAGKAAPGYAIAKAIIKLINGIARTINADAEVRDKLKVVFLPDYDVTFAQKIIPAADLSEQISTAGMEASGTGNMKLALNGALTIGTLDGANIEIRDHVGADNIFIFGLTADEAAQRRAAGYLPRLEAQADAELHGAIERIDSGFFSPEDPENGRLVTSRLLADGEQYLVLADFTAYMAAQDRVDELYQQPDAWSRKAVINCLNMGYFSSDRSISEYAERIWNIKPVL
jgi:glycogen phosphorylase